MGVAPFPRIHSSRGEEEEDKSSGKSAADIFPWAAQKDDVGVGFTRALSDEVALKAAVTKDDLQQ